ncbi:DUF2493 domain-containing protein [Comamonas antarctica]|uniref:DUF2493 domain-containing protein n=1 Tax=Comamonas antarctica TaxID=2743470 RepID=UPI0028E618B9|nr:DUF2493 domain-containing protein [Comamonas antarctica]
MRVIVAGSRDIVDKARVMQALEMAWLFEGINPTCIVSGTARGVDRIGERIAAEHRLAVARYPAKWQAYGDLAGHIRNGVMAANADALVAVWDGRSPGTKNMIKQARLQGLKVYVFTVE